MATRTPPLLILASLLIGSPAISGPLVGLSWQPSFSTEAVESGLAVGEFDGLLKPTLSPFAGWRWGAHQVTLTGGVAAFSTRTEQSYSLLGNLRLGVDYKKDVLVNSGGIRLWFGAGLFQLIPLLRDENDTYSETESDLAEIQTSQLKAQLSGTGIRAGFGVDIPIRADTWLGFHHHFVDHLNFKSSEESREVNAFVRGESGIHVLVDF